MHYLSLHDTEGGYDDEDLRYTDALIKTITIIVTLCTASSITT